MEFVEERVDGVGAEVFLQHLHLRELDPVVAEIHEIESVEALPHGGFNEAEGRTVVVLQKRRDDVAGIKRILVGIDADRILIGKVCGFERTQPRFARMRERDGAAARIEVERHLACGLPVRIGIDAVAVNDEIVPDEVVWYGRKDADGFDATGGSDAYDTDARGAVFGVDFTRDAWTVGGALHAGAFDTDGTDGVNLKGEGTFMGASLYGAYAMNDWALTADLGAARYDMDVSGGVLSGLAFESVSADIDAYSLSAGFKAEKRIVEAGPFGLSADAGVQFLHFHQSDYSGAVSGDSSFRTSNDDVAQWTFPIGFTASGKVVSGEWTFTPSAALHYVYAAGDRAEESESRFAFGAAGTADFSAAFTDRHSMTAGLGLEARTDRMAFALTAGADSISSNQKAWTAGIRAQFLF